MAISQHVPGLVSLDLNENPVQDEGVQALAGSPNFRQLAKLRLARSGMGTLGARALAASPHLDNLKSLDVEGNAIGNKAREALRLRLSLSHATADLSSTR